MILGIPKRVLIIIAVLLAVGIIYLVNVSKRDSADATPGSTGCKVTVIADVLNVRAAPDPNAEIVGKFKQNAETGAEPQIQNGYRKIADNKWASNEFLKPVAGNCG